MRFRPPSSQNGTLDREELTKLLSELQPKKAQAKVVDMLVTHTFLTFDADHSGAIDFNEFLELYSRLRLAEGPATNEGDIKAAFEFADAG